MTGAFALSAALFQRERTGKGQRIDMAMLDVAHHSDELASDRLFAQRRAPQAERQPQSACDQQRVSNQRRAGDAGREQLKAAAPAVAFCLSDPT